MVELGARWTGERVEMLKTMWADGSSAAQIAAHLGCGISRSAVLGKVQRLRLPKRGGHTLGGNFKVKPIRPEKPKRERRATTTTRMVRKRKRTRVSPESGHVFQVYTYDHEPRQDDLQIPVEQRKTLLELTDETCKWPVGDPQSPDFFFCGAPTFMDFPYCACHCRIAYQPAPATRKPDTYRELPKNPARRFAA